MIYFILFLISLVILENIINYFRIDYTKFNINLCQQN